MRDQRLACRVAVDVPVLDQTRHRVGEAVRQMAARGIERDAGEHRCIHHFRTRLAVARIVDRADQEPADGAQCLRREQIGKRVGALRHRPIDSLCGV